MSDYKVGDKFEIVKTAYMGPGLNVGDIVEFVRYGSSKERVFLKPKGGYHDEGLHFYVGPKDLHLNTARPIKTEAEKRGAKFGVGGVIKATGERVIFQKEATVGNSKYWYVFQDTGIMVETYLPELIRLDHEPEYREIPFSEATHEQRMDHKNILWDGHPGSFSQVFCTHADTYVITIRGRVLPLIYTTERIDSHTNPTGLTVRIPA